MVAPTKPDQRIDIGLESIRLMLGDLPDVARDWPGLSEAEQVSWCLDWDQLMASDLRMLERQYRSDQMTCDQQVHCREVLRKLEEALPTIERLNLYRPPVSLDT